MNYKDIIIVVLVLVILGAAAFFGTNYIVSKAYTNGFNDGAENLYGSFLNDLADNGRMNFPIIQNNQTFNVELGILE